MNWTEALLEHAILQSANMTGAVLRSVNLSGARLTAAQMSGCDLTKVRACVVSLKAAELYRRKELKTVALNEEMRS